ncbi:Proteinkinasesubdomain-containingproteinPKL ccin9 [Mycena venus]|uniref:non-specific serine/threonine protein kinase n=1 Tax=Mycena venus TaxID=2733690 RepID=A0A8H6YD44_9AGAR|nr:Proteinkinasesubdomain-containingproteinPKL ccin9 [Mycena venus]
MGLLVAADFHSPSFLVTVETSELCTVLELRHRLCSNLSTLMGVPQSDVEIWKVRLTPPIPIEDAATALTDTRITRIATKMAWATKVASEIVIEPGGPPSITVLAVNSKRLIEEPNPESFTMLMKTARTPKSPSSLAKSTDYRVWQQGEFPVYDVELYYAGFAKFIDDCRPDSSLVVPAAFVCQVAKFMGTVAGIYKDELGFNKAVVPLLGEILGRTILKITNSNKTTPDVAVLSPDLKSLVLGELKRELGEGGCDASTQASLSVLRHWAQPENEGVAALACCPTYIVALEVHRLPVAGTTKLSAKRRPHPSGRPCSLRVETGNIALFPGPGCPPAIPPDPSDVRPTPPARFFPHVTSYLQDGVRKSFKYVAPLERAPTCVTFHCRTLEGDEDIVVKFVGSYSAAAHTLLAGRNMAPDLLYYGDIDSGASYSGAKMVVMGYIAGKTLSWLQEKKTEPLPDGVGAQLVDIVRTLHEAGFVYGDLREPNVMVTDEAHKVQLIDFDWAGKAGGSFLPRQPLPQLCNGLRGRKVLALSNPRTMTICWPKLKKNCSSFLCGQSVYRVLLFEQSCFTSVCP